MKNDLLGKKKLTCIKNNFHHNKKAKEFFNSFALLKREISPTVT